MKKYKFLEHTADIKFQVYGSSLNEIFENTALAISEISARDEKIKIKPKKKIAVEGKDLESLLYNFIEELLFFLDAKNFVIAKAKLKVDKKNFKITGELFGDKTEDYHLDHIKAATYAEIYVKKTIGGWEAQTVVDV